MLFNVKQTSRLDAFLRQNLPQISRQLARRLIREGQFLVNGRPAKKGQQLMPGEVVEWLSAPDLSRIPLPQSDLEVELLTLDKEFLVLEKPAGLHTICNTALDKNTAANWVAAHYPECIKAGNKILDAGIAHRLDRDTSGLLLVARTKKSFIYFRRLFTEHEIEKKYLALVDGHLAHGGAIELPLIRHSRGARMAIYDEQCVCGRGKTMPAVTKYQLKKNYAKHTLLELTLITGVQHQLRIHLAHLGHPVVGEDLYGSKASPHPLGRYFLHAHRLCFKHPSSKQQLVFESNLPAELKKYLAEIG